MRPRPYRPGFDLAVDQRPTELLRALATLIEPGAGFIGRRVEGHLMLSVPEAQRHFWSPWLHLEVVAHRDQADACDPQRAYLRGFFTPHPNLWSSFLFAYLAFGTLTFFACIWALAQLQLDRAPSAALFALLFAFAALALHLTSVVGRRLAGDQMDRLEQAVRELAGGAGSP